MNEVLLSRHGQGPGNIGSDGQHTGQTGTYRGQKLFEVATGHVLHNHSQVAAGLDHIMYLHDFSAMHTGHRLRLSQELLPGTTLGR